MKTFEEYLQEIHATECPMVLDDDMPDSYNNWLSELQVDDWIKYAEEWKEILFDGIKKDVEKLGKILTK